MFQAVRRILLTLMINCNNQPLQELQNKVDDYCEYFRYHKLQKLIVRDGSCRSHLLSS